jgi:hypothetical protein
MGQLGEVSVSWEVSVSLKRSARMRRMRECVNGERGGSVSKSEEVLKFESSKVLRMKLETRN